MRYMPQELLFHTGAQRLGRRDTGLGRHAEVKIEADLGADVFRDAYLGLMDRNLDKRLRKRITAVVESVDGVVRVGRVRGRHIGQEIGLDLNFRVAPETGVAAAEALGARVKEKLLGRIPHLGSIQLTYTSRGDESRLPAEPARHNSEATES